MRLMVSDMSALTPALSLAERENHLPLPGGNATATG